MKKPVVVSVIVALMLLAWGIFTPSHSQDPAKEEKPTFYRLIPGVYVNGWPRFTVIYPKDWVEVVPMPQEAFRAVSAGGTGEVFAVIVFPNPQPLDKIADVIVSYFKVVAKEVTVVSDKPSQLRDGTPVREVEIQAVLNGLPFNYSCLCVKYGDMWIMPAVSSQSGRIGDHLKAILYSLQYEPSKDEPVKLPADVQAFLDKICSDFLSHDLAKYMTHFSDRYLHSGVKKGEMERHFQQRIGFTMSFEVGITDFVVAGDRAYLAGFQIFNGTKFPFVGAGISIIKENGEWKWYGNQRDVSP